MTLTHQSANVDRRLACAVIVSSLVVVVQTSPACAQGVRGVVPDLIRGTARVTDDLPLKHIDELIANLSKSRAAREAVDAELRKAGRLTGSGDVVRGAVRSDEVLQLLRSAASELDPSVLRRLEQLDNASRDAALVFARGGDELSRTVPDLATRGRLIREGGPETVAAVGMFGPDAGRAAVRLDEAIKGGSVVVKGGRATTVADFGKVMTHYGDASWRFWQAYIQPHWKAWAASGALAGYLSNPEYFQDAAGRLTEAGFQHLAEFVGEVAASAIRGVGGGSGKAVDKVTQATWETFFSTVSGVYSVVGTLIFVAGIALCFHRPRNWVRGWLRRVMRSTSESNSSESKA